jgi:sugar phosphate isomerase/epimerase
MNNENRPGDALHQKHMDALKRVVDMAHVGGSPLVRIMTQKKEQILRGHNGAEQWNVAKVAWDTMPPMIAPAMDFARQAGVTLVVETDNGNMVNSSYTARKLIDELDAKDTLKVLWDPANNCWCHEVAYPDGYDSVRDVISEPYPYQGRNGGHTPRNINSQEDGRGSIGTAFCAPCRCAAAG